MNVRTAVEPPQGTQGTQGWGLENKKFLAGRVINLVPAWAVLPLYSLGSLWLNSSV